MKNRRHKRDGALFFAFSGLWLYFQMWASRKERGAKDRWFWK